MKEFTLLSGKGGTGKTSISAALASLVSEAIFCDNDVDAADLHLIFKPEVLEKHQFEGAWVASIKQDICTQCGICMDTCRFNSIHENNGIVEVNAFQCEGCRLCERVCPVGAIQSERSDRNFWYISATRFGTLVHARMAPGEENSGKLVALIRNKTKEIAQSKNLKYIINDGPPGIGCTAISSITGTDHILLVSEPTKSGLHDAIRVIELAKNFKVPISALINKFDLNADMSDQIETELAHYQIPILARLPFDEIFVEAMIEGKNIVEFAPDSSISKQLKSVWEYLKDK
ncbi:MAG: ATP-binding protein [Prolixibacteraceae bacterium]